MDGGSEGKALVSETVHWYACPNDCGFEAREEWARLVRWTCPACGVKLEEREEEEASHAEVAQPVTP